MTTGTWRDVPASLPFSPRTMGEVNANAPEENRFDWQRGRPRRIHVRGLAQHQLRGGFQGPTKHAIIMQAYVDCNSFSSFNRGFPPCGRSDTARARHKRRMRRCIGCVSDRNTPEAIAE